MAESNLTPPNASPLGTAGPQSAGLAVLDGKALDKLRELDPKGQNQLLERVLGAYAQSLQNLLMSLPADVGLTDVEALRQFTHTLKSSSASVGAMHMAACCAQTEKAAKEGNQSVWQSNVPQLRSEANRLLNGLVQAGYVAADAVKGVAG